MQILKFEFDAEGISFSTEHFLRDTKKDFFSLLNHTSQVKVFLKSFRVFQNTQRWSAVISSLYKSHENNIKSYS